MAYDAWHTVKAKEHYLVFIKNNNLKKLIKMDIAN
jgi:hypothetical protein